MRPRGPQRGIGNRASQRVLPAPRRNRPSGTALPTLFDLSYRRIRAFPLSPFIGTRRCPISSTRSHYPAFFEHVDTVDGYQEAKALVRSIRATLDRDQVNSVRMIFAKNAAEAEKLLSTPRDERVIGED